MKRFSGIGWLMCCWLIISCSDSKVDWLRLQLMEKQLTGLENWQRELNSNITALQGLVDALNNSKYITSVTETAEGYTMVLNDRNVLQLYHGHKGSTGDAGQTLVPLISVRDSSDGHVYWTVNGKVISDKDGNAVRADGDKGQSGDPGQQGEQGEAGTIPQVRINADTDMWEISTDRGQTWRSTGVKATGEKGEQGAVGPQGSSGPQGSTGAAAEDIFARDGIQVYDTYVEFTLTDGQVFRLPRYVEWALTFPGGTTYRVSAGGRIVVRFSVTGQGGVPFADAAGNNGWLAEARIDGNAGEINITAPAKTGSGQVVVILSNGNGKCWTYLLSVTSF